MLQNFRKYFQIAVLIFSVACIIVSCKENTILGSNVVPSGDNILTSKNFGDTVTMFTKTVYDDSLITSYTTSPIYHALGSMTDPFAGETHANIAFQVIPPTTNFTFSGTLSTVVIDSTVLVLPYSGFAWGDSTNTSETQVFRVFQISEPLSWDTVYYAGRPVSFDKSNLLGTSNPVNIYHLRDSVSVAGTNVAPQLRIRLNPSKFQANILSNLNTNTQVFNDYPSFVAYFPGFYIQPDTENAANHTQLPYFRLDGSNQYSQAGIVFYYHSDVDTFQHTANFNYSNTANQTAHYNYITRVYNNYPIYNYVSPHLFSTAVSDLPFVFLQNQPGLAIDIKLPYVKSLPPYSINKAQLILTQVSTDFNDAKFSPPNRIFPRGIDVNGAYYDILDRYPLTSNEPFTFIDGTLRTFVIGGLTVNQYIINFPRELQHAIIQRSDTLHLRIVGTSTFPAAYRLVVGSRLNPNANWKAKLNVIYSKLNQ